MGNKCGGTKYGALVEDADGQIRCIWHRLEDGFFCWTYLNRRKCDPTTGRVLEGVAAKPWYHKNWSHLSRDEYVEKHPEERDDLIMAQRHSFHRSRDKLPMGNY